MSTTPPATAPAPKVAKTPGLTLLQKTGLITDAWSTIAPENKYANKTLQEYITASAPFLAAEAAVQAGKMTRAGNVVTKDNADKTTLGLVNAVVASIKGDQAFGPDSPLYRACGYIPLSERSAPTPVDPAAPVVPKPSITMVDRLALVKTAWEAIAPENKFSGMTLAEFKVATNPSMDIRTTMDVAHATQSAAILTRDAAAKGQRELNVRTVASVIATEGKASPLYRAMGYVSVGS